MPTVELYPYQKEGIDFLSTHEVALLAHEQGLGKTVMAIEASAPYDDILYVTPASLCENVRREFEALGRHAVIQRGAKKPVPTSGIVIVSYDTLRLPGIFKQLSARRWDVMICDEAQALKTPKSKRTQIALGNARVRGLAEFADRVWLMSGTPVHSHVGELWPALQALRPDLVEGLSYNNFLRRYCEVEQHPKWGMRVVRHKSGPVREFREKMERDFMLRRLKRDVLPELPPIRVQPAYISVPLTTSDRLEELLMEMADDGVTIDHLHSDSHVVDEHVATIRRETEVMKVPEIVKLIHSDFDGGMAKLIVFAHHHEALDALAVALSDYDVARCDGRMSAKDRQEGIDRFHLGSAQIFLGQTHAAGTGLTLHANGKCSDVLFCSLDFTPAINSQAMMRVHRIGQPNACLIRYAVASDTFDERVNDILAAKTRRVVDLMEIDL